MRPMDKLSALAARVRSLITQAERAAPDAALGEVAGEVFVGDVYSLQPDVKPAREDGWGKRRYVREEEEKPGL